jgi:hypothetical protein
MLGSPAERPHQLIAQLTQLLDGDARILAAWLALAQWPDTDDYTWYLDIHSHVTQDEISRALASVVGGLDLGGRPIDVVITVPGTGEGTGIQVKPNRVL